MLNHDEIVAAIDAGDIAITPLTGKIGPNSVDVHLHWLIKWPTSPVLDPRELAEYDTHDLRSGDFVLEPGQLYIGSTVEYCENNSRVLVPRIDGVSSIARLGLSIHQTAGFGDIAFSGAWTLEIVVVRNIRVYNGMRIAQLSWERSGSESSVVYSGKYQCQTGPTVSLEYAEVPTP